MKSPNRVRNWAVGMGCAAAAIALVVIGPGLVLGAMLVAGAERAIYSREKSPDGWHEARVQFDDGGAVSGFSRLVFVKHRWNISDQPLLNCRAFWGNGEALVRLTWRDSNTLIVEHHFAPENVEAVAKSCGPVRIVTRAIPPFEKH